MFGENSIALILLTISCSNESLNKKCDIHEIENISGQKAANILNDKIIWLFEKEDVAFSIPFYKNK